MNSFSSAPHNAYTQTTKTVANSELEEARETLDSNPHRYCI